MKNQAFNLILAMNLSLQKLDDEGGSSMERGKSDELNLMDKKIEEPSTDCDNEQMDNFDWDFILEREWSRTKK